MAQDINQSHFHIGEQRAQDRYGARQKMEEFANKVVRDYMPVEHRELYAELPFVLLGASDDKGRPWVSLVTGRPGFLTTPDERSLEISSSAPVGDPIFHELEIGDDIGVLGIELEARRRNRITGKVAEAGPGRLVIEVGQTFGNCPRFIQARTFEAADGSAAGSQATRVSKSSRIDARARQQIETADTLFIATAYSADTEDLSHGADVSHRGGKPGFVKVEGERTFVFPDFSGNNHFNTVGNIVMNPKVGFLFIDFESRDLVYLTGEAEIVWEGPEVEAFDRAERLVRVRIDKVIRVEESLPFNVSFGDYSPALKRTGEWRAFP